MQEFNAALSAYVLRFSPKDGAEWQRVLDELTTFMHAEVGTAYASRHRAPPPHTHTHTSHDQLADL